MENISTGRSRALPTIGKIGSALMRLAFPEMCAHCRQHPAGPHLLCTACMKEILITPAPQNLSESYYQTGYLLPYAGSHRTLFKAAKFAGRRRALQYFEQVAQRAFSALRSPGTCFLPMPSSRAFLRQILRANLPRDEIHAECFQFRKIRGSGSNKLLGDAARFRRIRESLVRTRRSLPVAQQYVLCDDVLTTGATLGHAAWLLENEGISREHIRLFALFYQPRTNFDVS